MSTRSNLPTPAKQLRWTSSIRQLPNCIFVRIFLRRIPSYEWKKMNWRKSDKQSCCCCRCCCCCRVRLRSSASFLLPRSRFPNLSCIGTPSGARALLIHLSVFEIIARQTSTTHCLALPHAYIQVSTRTSVQRRYIHIQRLQSKKRYWRNYAFMQKSIPR